MTPSLWSSAPHTLIRFGHQFQMMFMVVRQVPTPCAAAAVFSDGLHHEGGPLVVGGRLDAVAVLVARRQLQPLVADLNDCRLGGGKIR